MRPADTAVRAHRRLVRHHRVDVALVVADVVGAGDVVGRLPAVQRGRHRPARVGAVVGQDPGADAEHAAVVAHRGADPVDLLARVHARLQVLAAVADPLDRGLHPARQVGDEDVLGVQQRLLAEAAADVGRDDPDVVLGDPQEPRRRRAEQVRRLVAVVDHELVAELVVRGRDGAGLHAHGGVALRGELEVDGEVGLLERGVGIAGHAVEPHVDVVGRTLVHHGGALFHRLVDRRHRGQGLVLDPDLVGAVLGRVPVLGYDGDDRLAHEAALLGEEDLLRRLLVGAVAAVCGDRVDLAHEVLGREDGDHPGDLHDPLDVDGDEVRVGVRAARERDVQRAGDGDVVGVVPAPGEIARVLDVADTRADPVAVVQVSLPRHRSLPSGRSAAPRPHPGSSRR